MGRTDSYTVYQSFRVNMHQAILLEKLAILTGRTKSDLLREALELLFKKYLGNDAQNENGDD